MAFQEVGADFFTGLALGLYSGVVAIVPVGRLQDLCHDVPAVAHLLGRGPCGSAAALVEV